MADLRILGRFVVEEWLGCHMVCVGLEICPLKDCRSSRPRMIMLLMWVLLMVRKRPLIRCHRSFKFSLPWCGPCLNSGLGKGGPV
jgi:hypothetical protein